jgi:hypothetical protein
MGYSDELAGWSAAGEHDLDELASLHDANSPLELHRRLVMGGGPGGSSTRHQEAIEVLQAHHGRGQPGAVDTALLLCTCWRWHRCTARLIAGIVATGILDPAQLDELAARLLWPDQVVYPAPAEWFAGALTVTLRDLLDAAADPAVGDDALGEDALEDLEDDEDQTVGVIADLGDGIQDLDQVVFTIDRSKPVLHERPAPPPLRRWAAGHVVSGKPEKVDAVVARARSLGPRSRDGAAVINGVLDAAGALDPATLQRVAEVARCWPQSRVRTQALELLARLDAGERPRQPPATDRPACPACDQRAAPPGCRSHTASRGSCRREPAGSTAYARCH